MDYERELKQTFNNSTYYVRSLCTDSILYVEVEEESTGAQWKNQFGSSYIEEMTTKTGNFKTFDKFCRMMYSALESNNNGSVFIDLLTYQDLEILKARKAVKAGIQPQSLNVTQRTKNKRYLILTYVVEFDRIHYPLALKLDTTNPNASNEETNANANANANHYPSHKLTDIIEILEDEIKILKKELEKKNLEIKRISKSTKQFKQKNISKRLDDFEDEIERLSTELLSERSKCRKINRQFNAQKMELNKKIEMLSASNDHYRNKVRSLKNDLNSTKQTLDNVRIKASKQRLYSTAKSSETLRRSRSRNNKYYPKRNNHSHSHYRKNKLAHSYNKNKAKNKTKHNRKNNRKNNRQNIYFRSSSAPRFQNKRVCKSRSRSPSIRFDPTEWANNRKAKIERAKVMKGTFAKSRSPSPFRTSKSVSRSVSPIHNILKKRDRSNSRKRNKFGTKIPMKKKYNPRLPLHPIRNNDMNRNNVSVDSSVDENDDNDDDDSIFNPTKEIESIDSRLNALQKFLRAAKSSK